MNDVVVPLKPQWMGAFAAEAVASAQGGKVAGATSNGVFLLVGRNSVFLTRQGEKSPFNIQLSEESNLIEKIVTNDLFNCSCNSLIFTRSGAVIDLKEIEIWTSPPPLLITNAKEEQLKRMQILLELIRREVVADKGLLSLAGAHDTDEISLSVSRLRSSFLKSDLEGCLNAAKGLIGYGGGLTPSGDDLLAGFLLFHSRGGLASSNGQPFVEALGEALTGLAYGKTTWISANRIEAACRGWSESIFLETLDYISNESTEIPNRVMDRLLGFGHSSGVDTLMGFWAAVETQ